MFSISHLFVETPNHRLSSAFEDLGGWLLSSFVKNKGWRWSAARRRARKPIAPSPPLSRTKRWRWIGLGAALAAGLGVALYFSKGVFVKYQAARHFERATESLAARQHDSARAELRSVLRLQPTHREARRRLAELELRLGRLEHAFLEFQSFT